MRIHDIPETGWRSERSGIQNPGERDGSLRCREGSGGLDGCRGQGPVGGVGCLTPQRVELSCLAVVERDRGFTLRSPRTTEEILEGTN